MTTTALTGSHVLPAAAVELFEQPPTFTDPQTERRHRLERVAAALRLFSRLGYEEGLAGMITVRDPQWPDRFWANPMGVPFSQITVGDLVLLDEQGAIVHGRRPVNVGAFNIHAQIHAARPSAVAAVHTHSLHGRAFSALGVPLAPLTQDDCQFFEDHAVFEDYTGIVLDGGDGRRIASVLGERKAVILRNHGLLTVGASVDAAVWWFVALDRCCHTQLLARAAGTPLPIPDEVARLTGRQIGGHLVGWNSFQPMYRQIVRSDPDLFDVEGELA